MVIDYVFGDEKMRERVIKIKYNKCLLSLRWCSCVEEKDEMFVLLMCVHEVYFQLTDVSTPIIESSSVTVKKKFKVDISLSSRLASLVRLICENRKETNMYKN